jgi:hypothetical protein
MPLRRFRPYGSLRANYFFDEFTAGGYNSVVWSLRGSGGSANMVDGSIGGQLHVTASNNKTQEVYQSSVSYSAASKSSFASRSQLASVASVALSLGFNAASPNNATSLAAWVFDTALGTTWRIRSVVGGSTTTTDTGITADTNWHEYGVIIDATAVQFFLDGAFVAAITANIPTLELSPFFLLASNGGTKEAYIDFIEAWNERG